MKYSACEASVFLRIKSLPLTFSRKITLSWKNTHIFYTVWMPFVSATKKSCDDDDNEDNLFLHNGSLAKEDVRPCFQLGLLSEILTVANF